MTKELAIKILSTRDRYVCGWTSGYTEALDMAVEALKERPTGEWIPIKWHTITEEEREREGYPKDWVYYLDCEMPEDGQEILVTTKHGYVEKDVCYLDDGYSLDSGWDWIEDIYSLDSGWDWREDIVAWMEMPTPYREDNK